MHLCPKCGLLHASEAWQPGPFDRWRCKNCLSWAVRAVDVDEWDPHVNLDLDE